jgi:hypothetical protein
MSSKKTKPNPETACRFRGGPWDGKLEFMAVGPTRIDVPADGQNPAPGYYRLGTKLRELRHKNAIEYAYAWVPEADADHEGVAES